MELYLDGHLQPLDRPALPARDRGVLWGEAVYEGVKVVGRRPLWLGPHLERLAASSRALGVEAAWEEDEARRALGLLLDAAGLDDALGRFYLTRGVEGGPARRLAWVEPVPARSLPAHGAWRVALHPERIVPYLPGVKHTNRLAHARARAAARAAGADDALLVHADGWVLEGTAANVFLFEADTLHTPALACGILAGITRDVVLDLAPGAGFRTVEGRYPPEILVACDEAFLTFTSGGVVGIAAVGEAELPAPAPGPRTRRIAAAYEERVAAALAETDPV